MKCKSCIEIKTLRSLMKSLAIQTDEMQNKMIFLLKEPVGLSVDRAEQILGIFGEINSIAQKLEQEGKKILQEQKSKRDIEQCIVQLFDD